MSVIECKSCNGRFRMNPPSAGQKVACPKCGVPLRTESSTRVTTRRSATENVTADGGLRMSGMVTRQSPKKKPVVVVAAGILVVAVVTLFLAMNG